MKKYYKINEIAKLYNIKTDSLRYYEEVGLICPMRSKSNYRLYTLNDIYILNIIRDCLKLGYDTHQIKEYLDKVSLSNNQENLPHKNLTIKFSYAEYLLENVLIEFFDEKNTLTIQTNKITKIK